MRGAQDALRQVILSIANGQRSEDHRGVVYTQQFGEAFLVELKKAQQSDESKDVWWWVTVGDTLPLTRVAGFKHKAQAKEWGRRRYPGYSDEQPGYGLERAPA